MEIFVPDLLHCILKELQATHRPSIFAATLVCKDWHAVAQRIIDSRIDSLIISPGSEVRWTKLLRRLQDDEFRKGMHRICVKEVYASGTMLETAFVPNHPLIGQRVMGERWVLDRRSDVTWAQLEMLTELISTLPFLSSFEWSAKTRIPPCILAALSQRPFCSIHIHLREEPSSTKTITFAALETPASLSSLHAVAQQLVTLSAIIPATNSAMLVDLGNLIAASSKTLRNLAIYAAGRTRPVSAQRYTTVTDFRWLTDAVTTPLRLRSLTLLNLCLCEIEDRAPLTNILSSDGLRSLHITCSVVHDFLPDATQLHRLEIRDYSACNGGALHSSTIRAFLARQWALKELELLNGTGVMHAGAYQDPRELLEHLGKTLEVFNSRGEDRWPEGYQTRAIDEVYAKEEMLRLVGSCFRRLRDVGIQMPRADAYFDASLQSIKQRLPAVHRLQLFLEPEKPGDGRFRTAMTLERAVSVWHTLRVEPQPMRMLERLIIEVGPSISLDRVGFRVEDMHLAKLWRKYRVELSNCQADSRIDACLEQIEDAEERYRQESDVVPSPVQKEQESLQMIEQTAKAGLVRLVAQQMFTG